MASRTDDIAVAQRVLDHIARGTTDAGAEVWREPVANYLSGDRYSAEIALLRRTAVPFCPSAALPGKGSYLAREAAGVPILAVRGADGKVRAFRNACRHRGAQVAQGEGCAKSFVCPYHAWTYELDGRLRHVPHEDGFPGLDKGAHGLVPVSVQERLGVIFINQDGSESTTDPIPALLAPGREIIGYRETELEANWKIFLESFIEGYHIRYTHPESFYPYGFDNLNVIDLYGRSGRITYPFRRIRKLEQVEPAKRRVQGLLTYVYHVFPNALVTILSRHTNLVVLEPLAPGRTRQHSWTVANDAGEEALAEAKRDQAFVGSTGALEDRAVVESIQRGLKANANQAFTFGRYEPLIGHFHRTLDAALAASPRTARRSGSVPRDRIRGS
ncbi:MAG TPA: SRPBCC family protein [Burkholderiales bacterium]|nr:SRPBCC family protein [Burkholderiales bacterium]